MASGIVSDGDIDGLMDQLDGNIAAKKEAGNSWPSPLLRLAVPLFLE